MNLLAINCIAGHAVRGGSTGRARVVIGRGGVCDFGGYEFIFEGQKKKNEYENLVLYSILVSLEPVSFAFVSVSPRADVWLNV